MLTREELAFLKSQGLSAASVYDGRGKSSADQKAGARSAGLPLYLGTACRVGNHRLRTRAGHCAQCDTSKISYQRRHHSPGFVYIAGSQSARLLKIGTAIDIAQREANLRNQAYGGIRDWKVLFTAWVENGGKIEGAALKNLKQHKTSRIYVKDGESQEAVELLQTSFTKAIKAVATALGNEKAGKLWKSHDAGKYEF